MPFQAHLYFFLWWNTKGDVLKNVDAALLMKVYGNQGLCPVLESLLMLYNIFVREIKWNLSCNLLKI